MLSVMSDTDHNSSPSTAASSRRDPAAARTAAAERVATAMRIEASVERFHAASDKLDEAAKMTADASDERLAALHDMREAGLTISEMASLTGLSSTRLQALTRRS
jgi:hypothetical protein